MKIAAVFYDGPDGAATDEVIRRLARTLQSALVTISGVVQVNETRAGSARCDMILEDLATGRRILVSDNRGPHARGCRLDHGALEESVGLATASLSAATKLVIVNRFGMRETEGHGFRPMIEQAAVLDVPVLIGLNCSHLGSWTTFLGEDPVLLPVDYAATLQWCGAQMVFGGASLQSLSLIGA